MAQKHKQHIPISGGNQNSLPKGQGIEDQDYLRIEQLLAITQQHTKTAYWEYDPSTRETYWSDFGNNILGLDQPSLEKATTTFLKSVHPEDVDKLTEFRKKLGHEDILDGIDFRVIVKEKIKYIRITAIREVDENGLLTKVKGTAQDITLSKLNEERLKKINQFANCLTKIDSEKALVWYVVKHIVNDLDFEDCILFLLDEPSNTLVQSAAYGIKNPSGESILNPIKIQIGTGITGHVAATKEPLLINDVSNDDRYISDIPNMGSEICVPVIYNDKLYGIIDCEHSAVNFFNPNHLDLLNTIATLVAGKLGQWDYLDQIKASETQYRNAQRIAHLGSWSWDLKTHLIQCSDETYRIFEIDPEITHPQYDMFEKIIHPDDRKKVNKAIRQATKGKNHYNVEFRIVKKNGDITYTHAQGEVYFDQNGIPEFMEGSISDITIQKNAEIKAKESEERLTEAFKMAPEAIIFFDNDLNIILFNQNAERIFGYKFSEVIGQHLNMLMPKKFWANHDSLVKEFRKSTNSFLSMNNVTGLRKNGETFPALSSVSKVKTNNGNQFIIMITDITERVRAEEDLRLSQQRLLLHREFSPVGIIEWNLNFEVLDWNPAAERIFGFSKEEALNLNIAEQIIPESSMPNVEKAWVDLLENKGDGHIINENLTKDHKPILCEWNNTSLIDENGTVIGVTSLVTNITERSKTEDSLRLSQQRLLLQRKQSPVGIIEWGPAFEVVDWNPAAEKIFGFKKEDIIGQNIFDQILPENARSAVDEICQQLLEQEGGSYSINENITKEGRTILCEWHNTPLVNDDGIVIGVSAIVEDITERKKQEDTIRQTQKMEALGQLTGGIAHDFNNMLGVILGFSQLLVLKLRTGEPKLIHYCEEILKAGERAKKLTKNLLEFSRETPASSEVTNFNKLLQGLQHMLERTLTPRIKLIYKLEKELWPVLMDGARLEDALLNISINAMHAMSDGGTLTICTKNTHLINPKNMNIYNNLEDYVTISLQDTGSGMTKDVQQKIFEPFFSTKGAKGTGLGMSQVYGFVQQSGGFIKVYSELNKGTKITICVPRHQGNENAQSVPAKIEPLKLETGHGNILVVDDETALLGLNKEILSAYGYSVLCAENGEEALKVLESNPIDLLLSDVIMPGMGGYQLATAVERLYPKIKIQMMSGYTDKERMKPENIILHNQRLQKPFSREQLLDRIKTLLKEDETKKHT